MILYLDTSSLVKLYVEEPGSAEVHRLVEDAELVTTSVVGFAGAWAALARRRRERSLTVAGHRRAKAALDADWPHVVALDVGASIAQSAGDLGERRRLRGFEALPLASFPCVAREFAGDVVRASLFYKGGRQRPRRAAGSTRAEPYERETGAPQRSSGPARRRA